MNILSLFFSKLLHKLLQHQKDYQQLKLRRTCLQLPGKFQQKVLSNVQLGRLILAAQQIVIQEAKTQDVPNQLLQGLHPKQQPRFDFHAFQAQLILAVLQIVHQEAVIQDVPASLNRLLNRPHTFHQLQQHGSLVLQALLILVALQIAKPTRRIPAALNQQLHGQL